jgi:isopenicillin N synthase-like dioxygenase
VLEPFLCEHTQGLQVWDQFYQQWIDCDGPDNSLLTLARASEFNNGEHLMLLFFGKALASQTNGLLQPTLHRVVMGHSPRRTVIYEQKYQEFYAEYSTLD